MSLALSPAFTFSVPPWLGKGLVRLLFSLKTFAAAILALLASYLLELKEPQWAFMTAYLVSQPLVGAIWAKGAYRIAGTVVGAAFAVFCVGLFAQSGPLFIMVMALWLGACAFGATLARNYASYGFALAGFSAPMIGFEAMALPNLGWGLAVDRMTEVILGIVCVGVVHALVLPRYAGDALATSLTSTFTALARYAAIVLRPGTPESVFTAMRHRMAADVTGFDALRSYAVFESPELRGDDASLSRLVRAFLGLMSVARGLHVRLDDLRRDEDPILARLLDPALARIAGLLQAVAADRAGPRGRAVVTSLAAARRTVDETRVQLEALAGAEPAEVVANGLLVLQRAGDMIDSLSRAATVATGTAPADPAGPMVVAAAVADPAVALAQGVRAAVALSLVGVYWLASAWTAAVPAMTGLAIVTIFFVSAIDPARQATGYVLGAALAMVVAFFARAWVVPQLGDFVPLAALLGIVLIPAGIFMSHPTWGFGATVFAAFYGSQLGLANLPVFDTALYIDSSLGMLLGFCAGVLAIKLIMPPDPAALRRREWREVVTALPPAARGERAEAGIRAPILMALLKLLPRLDLARTFDDEVMIGSFGAASMSLELVRLRSRATGASFPSAAGATVIACLDRLGDLFERLAAAESSKVRVGLLDQAVAAVASARATLGAVPMPAGAADTVELVHALASLRFIADRLGIDRAFLTRTIPGARA